MAEFLGSIAQANVTFPIESVVVPIAGENFSRAVVYVREADAGTYLGGVSPTPSAGSYVTLTNADYEQKATGLLLQWLSPFFGSAPASIVYVAVYAKSGASERYVPVTGLKAWADGVEYFSDAEGTPQDTTNPPDEKTTYYTKKTVPESEWILANTYARTKTLGYFKFAIAPASDYNSAQAALSALCTPDTEYSQMWVGTSDAALLAERSSLLDVLADSNARVVYNGDSKINPALAQLGATLSAVNPTGTPVGNSMDMVAFSTIQASGAVVDGQRANLTAMQKTALDALHVGYDTWVGDGSEDVVTEGSMNLKGESVGAEWIKAYITHQCRLKAAEYVTRMNVFLNESAYRSILAMLGGVVRPFVESGRLSGFRITAPAFGSVAFTKGDTIVVPNAWTATYVDNVRSVRIYGTLYVNQATR